MSNHSVLDVSGIICHPDNNPENFYSDVAVLKLATPIQVTSQLIPACLANARTEKLKDAMLQTLLVRSLDCKYTHKHFMHHRQTDVTVSINRD